jgi:hypothetical protein
MWVAPCPAFLRFGGYMADMTSATVLPGKGFKYLAKRFYTDENKYQPIIDANTPKLKKAAAGKPDLMAVRQQYAEQSGEELPVLYAGDELWIPIIPPEPESDTADDAADEGGQSSGGGKGAFIRKKRGNLEYQAPNPRIEVLTPPYDAVTMELNPLKSALSEKYQSQNLLSYTFAEGVDDLEGSFSFTVANEQIDDNGTLFDAIVRRSIIKIYEDEDSNKRYPTFVGIVRRRHFEVTMTSSGPRRSVIFYGKSIISCITEFMVSLDVKLYDVQNATAKTKELTNDLKSVTSISEFMKKSWEFFKSVSEHMASGSLITNRKLLDIISNEKLIGENFVKEMGAETKIKYPIATMFFNQSNNFITDVWRNILPQPVYELFARFDEVEGKPFIVVRQVPFGNPGNGQDWLDLDLYEISPTSLISYDLNQSDEEVYTAYNACIIGSPKDPSFYMNVTQASDTMEKDTDKCALYGFKLLTISFLGYDRSQETQEAKGKTTKTLKDLSEKAKYWFSKLDEMYSGTITLATNFKQETQLDGTKRSTNPRAGCRLNFLNGQFYITNTEHSWNYGGTPITRLTVSRGMVYDETTGNIKGEIQNIGKLYGELRSESESYR